MRHKVVIGLGFGDEGKGHVVNWLASQDPEAAVVRFSGGHQAEHHVVLRDGRDHVFSNFGSGTLQGAPTYWSRFCPVNPRALLAEHAGLVKLGVTPRLYIDPKCPVTTPYDIEMQKRSTEYTSHGSCGVGINTTRLRELDNYHLLYEDLKHPTALKMKLNIIQDYYNAEGVGISLQEKNAFVQSCLGVASKFGLGDWNGFYEVNREHLIFEGSQGLLLDQHIGFFPHVTPSNTGTKNVGELLDEVTSRALRMPLYEPYMVTRAYQTRHGYGPMNQSSPVAIPDNPHEKSYKTFHQGEFRKAPLDLSLLKYAVHKDNVLHRSSSNVVVTCLDVVPQECPLWTGDGYFQVGHSDLIRMIMSATNATNAFVSKGPTLEDIRPHA